MSTNKWAVLVSSSDYWFNYRHMTSVMALYGLLTRQGFTHSNILLLNALEAACSPLNPSPGCVYTNASKNSGMLLWDTSVDFKGREVSVLNFLGLLSGSNDFPAWKRLSSDENSLVLVYMSGHGGDGFFKFNDHEELSSRDLANVLSEMHYKRRYGRLLLVLDTCQAETLGSEITAPEVFFLASSLKGENSYGLHWSDSLSAGLTDRFSFALLQFLEQNRKSYTIRDLVGSLDPRFLHSHVFVSSTSSTSDIYDLDLLDFFSSPIDIRLLKPSSAISSSSIIEEYPTQAYLESFDDTEDMPSLQRISAPLSCPSTDNYQSSLEVLHERALNLVPLGLLILYLIVKWNQPQRRPKSGQL